MQSLLIRIFLSFWLIIGVTIGIAAVSGYWYAERIRESYENFDLGATVLNASAALDAGGRAGLTQWLEQFSGSSEIALFVLDERGSDLLGRGLPQNVARIFERHRRHGEWIDHDHGPRDPANLRRARPLTQLVAASGEAYTFVISHGPRPEFYRSRLPAGTALMLLALLVSATVSLLLARAMTGPVRKLRAAAVALADGDLDVQVAHSVGKRRDELGLLARDFDEMARKLKKAAAQQSELSRNISHELRSPLARMRVALELVRQRAGESPEFDRIDDEAERLDQLIGQILRYTRLESGSADELADIDLADLVAEVVENVNYECRPDGPEAVTVQAAIATTATMRGYADAARSVLENILRNAVRHSPPQGVVTVTLDREDNATARIVVTDQGRGVTNEELPRLFDAFFRTRQSVEDTADRGSGLGLAIAARATRKNGGEISAQNLQSGGLAVSIRLPATETA